MQFFYRDGKSAPAKLAFLTTDVVGQTYLCYLVPFRKQLLFSRLEKANTSERLIFGITAGVPAIDAAPITVSVIFGKYYTSMCFRFEPWRPPISSKFYHIF